MALQILFANGPAPVRRAMAAKCRRAGILACAPRVARTGRARQGRTATGTALLLQALAVHACVVHDFAQVGVAVESVGLEVPLELRAAIVLVEACGGRRALVAR